MWDLKDIYVILNMAWMKLENLANLCSGGDFLWAVIDFYQKDVNSAVPKNNNTDIWRWIGILS